MNYDKFLHSVRNSPSLLRTVSREKAFFQGGPQGSVETVVAIVPFSCLSLLHKWWSSVGLITGLESPKALPAHARKRPHYAFDHFRVRFQIVLLRILWWTTESLVVPKLPRTRGYTTTGLLAASPPERLAWPQASSHPILSCGVCVAQEHDTKMTRIREALRVFVLLLVSEVDVSGEDVK